MKWDHPGQALFFHKSWELRWIPCVRSMISLHNPCHDFFSDCKNFHKLLWLESLHFSLFHQILVTKMDRMLEMIRIEYSWINW